MRRPNTGLRVFYGKSFVGLDCHVLRWAAGASREFRHQQRFSGQMN